MNRLEEYIENKRFIKWVFKTDEETDGYFEDYFDKHPETKQQFLGIKKELRLLSISDQKISFGKGTKLYQSIINQIKVVNKHENRIWGIKSFMRYAAIAIIFLMIGSVFMYLTTHNQMDLKLSEDLFLKNANHYPVLYFADGTKEEIISENKLIDFSLAEELIVGDDTLKLKNLSADSKNLSNLLVIPNGQRLKIRLYDKSIVWLNAGSRLIFPQSFDGKKREVYLAGEAFFDVAKDQAKPFLVNTSTVAVKVLGTKFNVSSYPDENEVVTVLQEGKVQILDTKSYFSKVKAELLPNQMARYNKNNNQLNISNTDHKLFTSWKDGSIQFEYKEVSQLITQVERYFNIRIKLNDPRKGEEKINGTLDLNVSMPEVLEYITKITHSEIIEINNNTYILE